MPKVGNVHSQKRCFRGKFLIFRIKSSILSQCQEKSVMFYLSIVTVTALIFCPIKTKQAEQQSPTTVLSIHLYTQAKSQTHATCMSDNSQQVSHRCFFFQWNSHACLILFHRSSFLHLCSYSRITQSIMQSAALLLQEICPVLTSLYR